MEETITSKDKTQFRIELILALILTGLACAAGMSDLFFAPNEMYPASTDFMGHMAKVRFIAQSMTNGHLPAWFPYWYNGTAVTQYYPPLSFLIMSQIFLLTNNVMLSFKIYCFSMVFAGGIGVWLFCNRLIGRWCGLFGIIVFCLQPYIIMTLFGEGQIAQGPIIALTPWYLISILNYTYKPTAKRFLICMIICFLLILSHPNSIFMSSLCIMIVLTVFIFIKKIKFEVFFYIGITIVFAGILTAFWSLVGVTGLENPDIPYLLPEAALRHTATIEWYTSTHYSTAWFYFAIPVSVCSIASILLFTYYASIKRINEEKLFCILFCILITIVTVIFSFGLRIPLFKYLPLADSFVPGRILSLTTTSASILCAYLIYGIMNLSLRKKISTKIGSAIVCSLVIIASIMNMNPYLFKYGYFSGDDYENMVSTMNVEGGNFDKGRYDIHLASYYVSNETYFPISHDFNMSEGFNIEGTVHNRTLWNQNIAMPSENIDYIAKNLAFWNVRSFLADKKYQSKLSGLINQKSFVKKADRGPNFFYASVEKSSYFLTDKRNALILGKGSPAVAIEFPYLIHEQHKDISDYSLKELEKYKLIYICEPAVDTIQEQKSIENMVETLVDEGVTVIIEPTITKGHTLFGITTTDMISENLPTIQKQNDSQIESTIDDIEVEEDLRYTRVLFGLDNVYYKLIQNGGRLENEIIGAKKAGNGEVIFIGKHLSQYLKAVYARNWGVPESESGYPTCADEVKALFTDIFKTYGVNTDFWPEPFPVKKADWNYRGVGFEYSARQAQEMTLSITYTPRWKATLDGKPIEVGQKENLVTLDLPAGDHEVKLVYGLTIYGIAGYIISLAGLLFLVFFIRYYGIITYRFRQIGIRTGNFLQLVDRNENTKELDTGGIHAEKQEKQQK